VGVVSHLLYGLLLMGYVATSFYFLMRASALGLMGGVPRAIAAIEWVSASSWEKLGSS